MNTDNLHDGMTVKNYKHLCELLGEKYCRGKQKVLQLKDWRRYFDYERSDSNNSFTIKKVYDTPYDKPANESSVFCKYIEYLLAEKLSEDKSGRVTVTKMMLYEWMHMVNYRYKYAYNRCYYNKSSIYDPKKFAKRIVSENHYNIQEDDGMDFDEWFESQPRVDYGTPEENAPTEKSLEGVFFDNTSSHLAATLKNSLNRLARRHVISYGIEKVIVSNYTYTDENGKSVTVRNYNVANEDDIRNLDYAINIVLAEMGYNSRTHNMVYAHCRVVEFMNRVKQKISEYGWEYVFDRYWIVYTPESIVRATSVIFEEVKRTASEEITAARRKQLISENRNGLNAAIVSKMYKDNFFKDMSSRISSPFNDEKISVLRGMVDKYIKYESMLSYTNEDPITLRR